MSAQVGRPFPSLGIGWLFAVLALLVAALGVLGAVNINATIVQVEIILLALALLL